MKLKQDFVLEETSAKWSMWMVRLTWVVIIIALIVGALFFWGMGGPMGEDLGALSWVIGFSAAIALISIRQTIWAERE